MDVANVPTTPDPAAGLYEQAGGRLAFERLAVILIGRLLSDDTLRRHFTAANIEPLRHCAALAAFLRYAAGDPAARYTGRGLAEMHGHLGITDTDWQLFLCHAAAALDAAGIPPTPAMALVQAVTGLRDSIVARRVAGAGGDDPAVTR